MQAGITAGREPTPDPDGPGVANPMWGSPPARPTAQRLRRVPCGELPMMDWAAAAAPSAAPKRGECSRVLRRWASQAHVRGYRAA